MVSKCANPRCSAVFRYLQRGKLFGHEVLVDQSEVTGNSEFSMRTRKLEYFWLCSDCASSMTLVFRNGVVAVEPLKNARAAAAD